MEKDHDKVLRALAERSMWEDDQRVYAQMRNDGLPRLNRLPWQANLHNPICDSEIGKWKPMLFSVFNGASTAEFCALDPALEPYAENAAQFHEWFKNEELRWVPKVMSAVDTMLQTQRGMLKVYYDAEEQKIKLLPFSPLYFVVPTNGVGPDEDDWFCHIKSISIDRYRRSKLYNQDPQLIQDIRGGTRDNVAGNTTDQEEKEREGLTITTNPDQILIFELWKRTAAGFIVREYSPRKPDMDLRPQYQSPYSWRGKQFHPFVPLTFEIRGTGWYEPRGIVEMLAPFEQLATKSWNELADWQTLMNRPTFETDEAQLNTENFQMTPGCVMPRGVHRSPPNPAPPDFMSMMEMTRGIAQDLTGSPEAGLAKDPAASQADRVTATQVNYHASLQTAKSNLWAWKFREDLSELDWRIWALICQYQPKQLAYYIKGQQQILPKEALVDRWSVKPVGPLQGWNKEKLKQDALALFQLFRGDPNMNQRELYTKTLETCEPKLLPMIETPDTRAQVEAAAEAAALMLFQVEGFVTPVLPNENQESRCRVLMQKMKAIQNQGVMVDQNFKKFIHQRFAQRLKILQEQNPKMAGKIAQMAMTMERQSASVPRGTTPASVNGATLPASPETPEVTL